MEGTAAFPLHLGSATVTDAFGDRQASVNTAELKLSIFPVYIRGCSDAGAVKAILAKATDEETQRREALQQARSTKAYRFGFERKRRGRLRDRRLSQVHARPGPTDIRRRERLRLRPHTSPSRTMTPWAKRSLQPALLPSEQRHAIPLPRCPRQVLAAVGGSALKTTGQLTVRGAAGGLQQIAVTKEQGEAEALIEVQATGDPLSIEMDGYAALRWLTLVPQKPTEK